MAFVGEAEILQVIRGFNLWWANSQVNSEDFKRTAFGEVRRYIDEKEFKRAIILSGARRVGKTILLHQLIDYLITQVGIDSKNVLYLSLDHPILKLVTLDKILDVYHQNVQAEPKKLFLFLDEIQYASDWGSWLKIYVDFKLNTKIVATGSASLEVNNKGKESGVGRWVTVTMPTLSFYEYLKIKKLNTPAIDPELIPSKLINMKKNDRMDIMNKCAELINSFNQYLLLGGFPETALMSDSSLAQKLLREDIVDKVLKRDMTALYKIRNVIDIERLFIYLCINTGGITEITKLCSELGLNKSTVQSHLNCLESANLIYRLNPINIGGKKSLKPRTKIYLADAAIRNAVLLKGEEIFSNPQEMGINVETSVFKHLYTFYYPSKPPIGYWKKKKTDHEVDLIINFNGNLLPVEVKYREKVSIEKNLGLYSFCEEEKPRTGFLVTKSVGDYDVETLPSGTKILKIPAFLFLYLLGQAERQ
ncbi:MAG: ATP-binding protein [Candidatus Melainabacteria bacterium]|nr:ATP-binding protein [Candidatus Melainabacteria bacterium]